MATDYSLGHSDAELRRLVWQADMLRPYTERLLQMAGIGPGMRVLDVGCGAGDVAMLAAKLVGPTGSVIGIDHTAAPLELATHRAADARLPWVWFQHASAEEFTSDQPFDAVIGRYVIFHQVDPIGFLRACGQHVAPSGLIAFHEMDAARPFLVSPNVPLLRQADDWLKHAIKTAFAHADAGSQLIPYFAAAGLPEPELRSDAPIGGGLNWPGYQWLTDTLRTLLPVLGKLGVSAEEVDIDTLQDRLRIAVTEAKAQVEGNPQILAMARM